MTEALLLCAGALLGLAGRSLIDAHNLRRQNDLLLDHVTRIQRREAGMSEVPRPPANPDAQKPIEIPADFEDLLMAEIESEAIRDGLRGEYRERRARGTTHETLMAELERQLVEDA